MQVAFSVPGTDSFTVWGYGTTDTLAEILTPNYLEHGGALVELGDLIYIRTRPRRDPVDGHQMGEVRTALVMVCGVERGRPSIRLVEDFGTPDGKVCSAAGDAMPTAQQSSAARERIKRRRGRPPLRRESAIISRRARAARVTRPHCREPERLPRAAPAPNRLLDPHT